MSPLQYLSNPDVVSTELGEEAVLLHLQSQRYYTVNETGLAIWSLLAEPRSLDEIVDALAQDFEVTREDARTAARAFLDELLADGLVREAQS
jgi:hypothetical protein